ncbi:hypothetical protein FACS189459_1780 [Bacilli bacterium]|nr:hypothetical protein FACS189459_1780 [Bacilli bacterium]
MSRKIKQFINTNTFQPCQIVILYRANYLSRPFEQELINNSIPYYIYGGLKFYQRMEIKDLLAYLKILSIPDEVSVKRVINVPKRNIGESTIDKVNKHALNKGISFLDALQLNDLVDWNTKNISLFFNLIEDIKSKIIGKSIAETVQIIFDEIKYSEYIDLIESEIDKANDRKQNIKELINSIKEFESKNPNTTISDYLQEISLYTEANDNTNNKNDSVILMTVHAAKGTEYPVVFIVGMNEKIFPTIRMGESPDIEEERRIAYVAITRAEQKLFLTSNTGFSFISNNYNTPSRFINEIGTNNFVRDKKIMDTISSANLE